MFRFVRYTCFCYSVAENSKIHNLLTSSAKDSFDVVLTSIFPPKSYLNSGYTACDKQFDKMKHETSDFVLLSDIIEEYLHNSDVCRWFKPCRGVIRLLGWCTRSAHIQKLSIRRTHHLHLEFFEYCLSLDSYNCCNSASIYQNCAFHLKNLKNI